MRKLVVLVMFGAVLAVFACGPGDEKPPLTPDTEHPGEGTEAGAPSTPATPPTK